MLTAAPFAAGAVSGGGLDFANLDLSGQDFSKGNYKGKDFTQGAYVCVSVRAYCGYRSGGGCCLDCSRLTLFSVWCAANASLAVIAKATTFAGSNLQGCRFYKA